MPRPTHLTAAPRRVALALALLCAVAGPLGGAAPVAAAPNGGARCEVPKASAPSRPAAKSLATPAAPTAKGGVIEVGATSTRALPTVAPSATAKPAQTPVVQEVSDAPLPSPQAGGSTPTAAPVDAATAALAADLTATARALGACLSEGKAETVADLATEAYLGQLFYPGASLSRAEFLANAADLLPVKTDVRTVENVRADGRDRATAEVTQVVGSQLLRSKMTFVKPSGQAGGAPWQVDREEELRFTPPRGSHQISATLSDGAFALDATEVKGPDVVVSGTNASQQDHEMVVLDLGGQSVTDLLRASGPRLPEWATYLGQVTVPAGGQKSLTLVGLAPGTYTIVCLFPDQQGQPHAAVGESATFTVN